MAPRRRQPSRKVKEDTLRKHILQRPDAYVGSVEKRTRTLWVYEGFAMARRAVTYVPELYKIFDEILVHAATNKQRDPAMDALYVDIDAAECRVSVFHNGDGVPVVEVHDEDGVYLPELVFGRLLTGSNHGVNATDATGVNAGYVSFVNGIATIGGGTHVDYVANKIANFVTNALNGKFKCNKITMDDVKIHLWVFVSALIDNPDFDSLTTKETLTTPEPFNSSIVANVLRKKNGGTRKERT
ncbi:hypothetical protein ACP70R_009810 [Stipagrostis hirtigluma subsp. patula]